jgi:hypothetical protein
MKKLVLVFLMMPFTLNAQTTTPPKGTNTIIIHGNISIDVVVKNLKERGYRVANDGYGGITTIPKVLENHGWLQMNVDVKDTTVSISGLFGETTAYRVITPELLKNKETYGGHFLGGAMNILIDFANSLHGNSFEFKTF